MRGVKPRMGKKSAFKQGYFPVDRSTKYVGERPCIYRSSYEYVFMVYCENNPSVKHWSSEPYGIPYLGPTGKKHNYYIDFTLEMVDGSRWLIEIKPYSDTIPQTTPRYKQNAYKWAAAKKFAHDRGWKFSIVTEQHPALKGKV